MSENLKFRIGDKVLCFNQIGDDFPAEIIGLNKNTARVRIPRYPSGAYRTVFSPHADARSGEPDELLVPYCDLKPAP